MEQLIKILEELRPDVDFEISENLMDNGLLDSFDVAELISEIEDQFGVRIDLDDIVPEKFSSAETIYALIKEYQAK